MDLFKMMKQANQIKNKAKEVEKNLAAQKLEVSQGGVSVSANAKQDILSIKIDEDLFGQGREAVEKKVLAAVQEASRKARDIMAQETKKMMGDVDMGSLGNMFK
ncbi:MAG: YbaB/EbfC family nucleoid-associated protein [bacterium]